MIIKHGVPQHNTFTICLPADDRYKGLRQKPLLMSLQDPKTGTTTKAKAILSVPVNLDEEIIPEVMPQLAYGIDKDTMLRMMMKRYPELQESKKIVFLILKKMEK